ncbi:MAG: hypothetical protein HUU55_11925 [Myxococcales bacterium]|nr:hypothetical protein [Myxococcales bacterium]
MPTVGPPSSTNEADKLALRKLAIAVSVVTLFGLLTYVLPGVDRFQPWVSGDEPLFVNLWRITTTDFTRVTAAPSIAAPMTQTVSSDGVREQIANELGEAIAVNLDDMDTSDDPDPQPTNDIFPHQDDGGTRRVIEESVADTQQPETAQNPGVESFHQVAQATKPESPKPTSHIDPSELDGVGERIELPKSGAFDSFYADLRATMLQKQGRITRIAHYGDSTIAMDDITSTVRRRLQTRFGDAGHGFMLGAKSYQPYGHRDIVHKESQGWNINPIINGGLKDGRYGYGGVHVRSSGGDWSSFGTTDKGNIGTAVSSFEVFYLAHPRGGNFTVQVDDGEKETISTTADGLEDRWFRINVSDGPHEIKVRAAGGGSFRWYGIALERDVPGVVYDSLGIVGARAARLLNADKDHLAGQLQHRDLSLLVLQFGGNEAVDRKMSMKWYRENLTQVLQHVRSGIPGVPCLFLAPLDQGERDERGRVRTIPIVPKMVEVQREVALEQGCGYWNTFKAMGGEGSMARWYNSKPRLAWGDFAHATPAGYKVIGNMFYKALLADFDDYLKRTK